MRSLSLTLLLTLLWFLSNAQRINEFHYSNAGTDIGEFIEVVLPTGENPRPYVVHAIDGSTGLSYFMQDLPLVASSSTATEDYYVVDVPVNPGLNNGGPNGIVLIDRTNVGKQTCIAVDFISYGGGSISLNDPALVCAGVSFSSYIGDDAIEDASTPIGGSIEWNPERGWEVATMQSRGGVNGTASGAIPTMSQWMLCILGLLIASLGVVKLYSIRLVRA